MKYTLLIVGLLFIASCSSTLTNSYRNSQLSKSNINLEYFYYDESSGFFSGTKIYQSSLLDSNSKIIYSTSFFQDINSGIEYLSPNGEYLLEIGGTSKREFFPFLLFYSKREKCAILDLQTNKKKTLFFKSEFNNVKWADNGKYFYFSCDDNIYKCSLNGELEFLYQKESLNNFIISPNEKNILIYYDDKLGIYNLESIFFYDLYNVGKDLGISTKTLKALSWNQNNSIVSFADWNTFYICNLKNRSIADFRAKERVFDICIIDSTNIIYVEGQYPSELSRLDNTRSFSIYKLNTLTEDKLKLNSQMNHSPYLIKLQLSPDRKFVLFAKRGQSGKFEIKLISLIDFKIFSLGKGFLPKWKLNRN